MWQFQFIAFCACALHFISHNLFCNLSTRKPRFFRMRFSLSLFYGFSNPLDSSAHAIWIMIPYFVWYWANHSHSFGSMTKKIEWKEKFYGMKLNQSMTIFLLSTFHSIHRKTCSGFDRIQKSVEFQRKLKKMRSENETKTIHTWNRPQTQSALPVELRQFLFIRFSDSLFEWYLLRIVTTNKIQLQFEMQFWSEELN